MKFNGVNLISSIGNKESDANQSHEGLDSIGGTVKGAQNPGRKVQNVSKKLIIINNAPRHSYRPGAKEHEVNVILGQSRPRGDRENDSAKPNDARPTKPYFRYRYLPLNNSIVRRTPCSPDTPMKNVHSTRHMPTLRSVKALIFCVVKNLIASFVCCC